MMNLSLPFPEYSKAPVLIVDPPTGFRENLTILGTSRHSLLVGVFVIFPSDGTTSASSSLTSSSASPRP